METKNELVATIKEWIKNENDIKNLLKEIKKKRQTQAELSASLLEVMKKNEIDCFDTTDSKIVYKKNKVKSSLSKKSLMEILTKYYQGSSEKAGELSNFIMENREEKIKETISRKMLKAPASALGAAAAAILEEAGK